MNPILILALVAMLNPATIDYTVGDKIAPDHVLWKYENLGEDIRLATDTLQEDELIEEYMRDIDVIAGEGEISAEKLVGLENAFTRMSAVQNRFQLKIAAKTMAGKDTPEGLNNAIRTMERNKGKISSIQNRISNQRVKDILTDVLEGTDRLAAIETAVDAING